jgi:hypothetical protein
MEPRIQYAQTKDGLGVGFPAAGASRALLREQR